MLQSRDHRVIVFDLSKVTGPKVGNHIKSVIYERLFKLPKHTSFSMIPSILKVPSPNPTANTDSSGDIAIRVPVVFYDPRILYVGSGLKFANPVYTNMGIRRLR
jgi:hypothetical protein